MHWSRRLLALLVLAFGLAGCASTTSTTSPTPPAAESTSATRTQLRNHPALAPARASSSSGLAYSAASADQVQPQPAPGTCHASGSGLYSEPDPQCTPGALNPAVTQATIRQTICISGYTETIRPAERITEPEKRASMAAYGDSGSVSSYEYDHLVSLELGGAANDPRNLWPEPGASPNPKDSVENELHDLVCSGQMSLAQAQHIIAMGWVAYARDHPAAGASPHSPATSPAPAPSGGGHCTASAAYSARYGDYDIYVHSDQPDQAVTATESSGRQASWHTDSSGNAAVYFKAPSSEAGETITVRVGGASCQTTL